MTVHRHLHKLQAHLNSFSPNPGAWPGRLSMLAVALSYTKRPVSLQLYENCWCCCASSNPCAMCWGTTWSTACSVVVVLTRALLLLIVMYSAVWAMCFWLAKNKCASMASFSLAKRVSVTCAVICCIGHALREDFHGWPHIVVLSPHRAKMQTCNGRLRSGSFCIISACENQKIAFEDAQGVVPGT